MEIRVEWLSVQGQWFPAVLELSVPYQGTLVSVQLVRFWRMNIGRMLEKDGNVAGGCTGASGSIVFRRWQALLAKATTHSRLQTHSCGMHLHRMPFTVVVLMAPVK